MTQESQVSVRRLHLLVQAARALGASEDLDVLCDTILESIAEIFGLNSSAVLLFDEEREYLLIERSRGYDATVVDDFRARRGEGISGYVAASGEAIVVPDVTKDPRYLGGSRQARSEMSVPLRVGGETLGVLDAESDRVDAFSEADLELFSAFASHVALAVHSARMREELGRQNRLLERRARRLAILNQAGRVLCSELDLDKLLQEILRLAREALELHSCAVLLTESGKDELVIRAALGYGGVAGMRIPLGEGITGLVARTAEPLLVPDVSKDPRVLPGELNTGCEMAVPMHFLGDLIGVLDAGSPVPCAFDQRDVELFAGFASYAAVALHNASLVRESRLPPEPE